MTEERGLPGQWMMPESEAPEAGPPVPHAEVMLRPAQPGQDLPDGMVQMSWHDEQRMPRTGEVTRWWRLDKFGMGRGVHVRVDVQARQRKSLTSPQHHVAAQLVLTGEPDDKAWVMIGDPDRPGSWCFGVLFHGATLLSTSAWLDARE